MDIPAYAHANEHAGTHVKIPTINPILRLRARYSIFCVGELWTLYVLLGIFGFGLMLGNPESIESHVQIFEHVFLSAQSMFHR